MLSSAAAVVTASDISVHLVFLVERHLLLALRGCYVGRALLDLLLGLDQLLAHVVAL